MSDDDLRKRLDRLESLVEDQQETIEDQQATIREQRERIRRLEEGDGQSEEGTPVTRRDAIRAGGLLALVMGGAGVTSADPQGQIGTSSDPLNALYTAELNGPVTGDQTLTDLTGAGLSVSSGQLGLPTSAASGEVLKWDGSTWTASADADTHVEVAEEGTSTYASADTINFGAGLSVYDDGNGTVTVTTVNEIRAVAFIDPNTSTPRRLDGDGVAEDYATGIPPSAIGPPTTDLTGDGTPDLPIRDGTDLKIVDIDGATRTLDSSGNVETNAIGVGDWNDDGTVELVYQRDDSGDRNLYSVALGRSPTNLGFTPGLYTPAVADFEGDGSQEIVWFDFDGTTNNLVYSDDGSTKTDTGYDGGDALGRPADFDVDGTVEVPVATGDIDLVEADGAATTLSTSYTVAGVPMGALDYTDTGVPDVIHGRGSLSPFDVYYYDVVNDATGPVTDVFGNTLQTTNSGIQ